MIKAGTLGFAAELTTSSMLPIINYSWAETEAALIEQCKSVFPRCSRFRGT